MNDDSFRPAVRNAKLAVLLVPGLLLVMALPASADRIEKHFKVDATARPLVTIHNPNGLITVRAWTKPEVQVIANRASDRVDVEAEQNGNRVDVSTHQGDESVSPRDVRADYEISVPEDTELQIHNDAGAVTVLNVLGDMNVETVAAGVDLEDAAGYLNVTTGSGSFKCVRCAGRIEVSSITGNFQLVDLRSYHVRAQTTKGDILFNGEFLPNGTYWLKNYSGVIEVRFSPGDSFDLSATSLQGKVNNEAKLTPPPHPQRYVPKFGNSLFGTFNAGRAKVELSSFDGTINILKRN
ncbi:MAG TPA: DUF4097 family beta strand repeat-containing protein [Candidatus Acidoferrales bacterium]|nr:DUF4097 family beta strand repeat-containing protein [Candidatus Acidoferrales bacterium]